MQWIHNPHKPKQHLLLHACLRSPRTNEAQFLAVLHWDERAAETPNEGGWC